ncbi:MAG: hypothetical protein IPI65_16790 [Bacteroidetes bacterium]|nr:hypothetical protein [Bacteroidota bacterium]
MIRIHKTAAVPNILTTDGATETTTLINAFTANPNQYKSRTGVPVKSIVKFKFDNKIYGDETVKTRLVADQHDKCCFCESKFSDNSFGDVEHYRPKGAYKKVGANANNYPGYYWLAYNWNNLMYSCEKCNRKHKKNDFPLYDETTRKPFHNHANDLSHEDTLLINPNTEDPSNFFTFKEEVPVPVNSSLKGLTSIKVYGLERLNNSRLENLKAIKIALTLVNIDETNATEIARAANRFENFSCRFG